MTMNVVVHTGETKGAATEGERPPVAARVSGDGAFGVREAEGGGERGRTAAGRRAPASVGDGEPMDQTRPAGGDGVGGACTEGEGAGAVATLQTLA
jgi:hypothetical protein